ncbi:thioesterase family protein [Geodermatophilus sp. SYSU D00703]
MTELTPGLSFTMERLVEERYCTRRGEYQIFSTPDLVLFIEETAIEAVTPLLPATQSTVGTRIDVAHVAATLRGQTAKATVTVTEVDRRRLLFDVEVSDEQEVIAKGTHERFIVDLDKFGARLAEKAASVGR